MRKLIIRFIILFIPVLVLFFIALFLPMTKSYQRFMYYSLVDKNKMLEKTASPRIIIIGGSNISFGINSQLIKDSLKVNPINMGIYAPIGLKYMLSNTVKYIRNKDVIVIVPEYQQFYNEFADGKDVLMPIIFDINPGSINLLDKRQLINILKYTPKYIKTKFRYFTETDSNDTIIGLYDRKSFNKYGDAYKHWKSSKEFVKPDLPIYGKLDDEIFKTLINYRNIVELKGAKLFISFPGYQELSFKSNLKSINEVYNKLRREKFNILSKPDRYKMNDVLIFNTPYHLTKSGVDFRTKLLIEDIKGYSHLNIVNK
jgi:hypothetical protein